MRKILRYWMLPGVVPLPTAALLAVLRHGADAVLIVDRERTITAYVDTARPGAQDLVGRQLDGLVGDEVLPHALLLIARAFSDGESGVWTSDARCSDGAAGWFETRVVPVPGAEPPVVALVVRTLDDPSARQRAERQASALRAMFDAMPAYVAIIDRKRWFLDVNRTERGVTDDSVLQLRVDDVTNPDHLAAAITAIERTFETGEITSYEARAVVPDGSELWATTRCARFAGPEGEERVVLAVSDITEQKRTEHALRRSQSRFRTLFEHLPDLASTVDRQRRIRSSNRIPSGVGSLERMTTDDFVDPADHEVMRAAIERTFATGASETYQVRALHTDGTRREIVTRTALLPTVLGDEPEVLLLSHDVTERAAAERALRASEQRYRMLAENLPDFVSTIGRDRRTRTINRLLDGYSAEQLLASRIEELNAPETAAVAIAGLERVFATGEPAQFESLVPVPGGNRWFRSRLTPIEPIDGEDLVLCITTDVTDVHAALEVLEERLALREQLQQAQKMEVVGQLAGGVAHDFNNLLLVLQSHLEFVRSRTRRDPQVQPELDAMEGAVQRAAELTRQLLTVGRQQPIQVRPVLVGSLLDEVIRLVRRTFPSSIGVDCRTEDGSLAVSADAGQLQQVLINLSINARDAMPDGGELRYEVARATGPAGRPEVRLTVRDTGRAMSPEIQARIFEPFFTTKGTQGSGLGLAMVDGIVRQHDGRIHVESTEGVGSAFHVYLRATDAVVEPAPPPVSSTRGSATILVAEDDPMVRSVVSRVLRDAGYEVIEACDGLEAITLFGTHRERIALVLADVMMPGLTGRGVYDQLAPENPQARFLFTSGYSAELLGDGLLDRKGIALLQKPYRVESLLSKVREVLDT